MKKILFIALFLFVSACFTPDDIVLNQGEKHAKIEALAKERMKQVKLEIETNCEQNFNRYVARAVDSLVAVHLDSTEYK